MAPKKGVQQHAVKRAQSLPPTPRLSFNQRWALEQKHSSLSKLQQEVHDALDIATPYGKLLVVLLLPFEDGTGTYEWIVCNPFALLWI